MILFRKRIAREYIIVRSMINMHCREFHTRKNDLCEACKDLDAYVKGRLKKCIFANQKPVCKDCNVHCYTRKDREKIKTIMRWAGPRMIYRHPLYAIIHLLDSKIFSNTQGRISTNDPG